MTSKEEIIMRAKKLMDDSTMSVYEILSQFYDKIILEKQEGLVIYQLMEINRTLKDIAEAIRGCDR